MGVRNGRRGEDVVNGEERERMWRMGKRGRGCGEWGREGEDVVNGEEERERLQKIYIINN